MKKQKVIITLKTGQVVTFEGPAQVDTSIPIRVERIQFTAPVQDNPADFDSLFREMFGGGRKGYSE